jgi:AraC-like DNA-binding protein
MTTQNMTYYHKEITRIGSICYSNKGQIETVIGTRHYINNNFDKELNLDLLSHIRFTSKFHLLRLFKRYYGQTPKQYLTDIRIEKAKELLAQGTAITETCFDIGFDSPSSFSTLFKSRVGITPTEFQKEQPSQSPKKSNF